MARGWEGIRPRQTLDECLVRLRGLAAATGCVGLAVEKEADGCPRLHSALQILGELALDEVEVAQKAAEEMCREVVAEGKDGAGPGTAAPG